MSFIIFMQCRKVKLCLLHVLPFCFDVICVSSVHMNPRQSRYPSSWQRDGRTSYVSRSQEWHCAQSCNTCIGSSVSVWSFPEEVKSMSMSIESIAGGCDVYAVCQRCWTTTNSQTNQILRLARWHFTLSSPSTCEEWCLDDVSYRVETQKTTLCREISLKITSDWSHGCTSPRFLQDDVTVWIVIRTMIFKLWKYSCTSSSRNMT